MVSKDEERSHAIPGDTQLPVHTKGDPAQKMKMISSNLKRFEALFEYLPKLDLDLRVKSTYRTCIVLREILKSCPRLDPPVRFASFLVIHVPAYRTDPSGWDPLLKSPFPYLALTLHPTDRTDVGVREIFKPRTRRDTVMRFAP
jgi:hypothetical protein